MKTLFICVALVVVFCNILKSDAACNSALTVGCETALTTATGANMANSVKCLGAKTYKECMKALDCYDSTAETKHNDEFAKAKCAGVSMTVSVSLILMSVMAAIKNYF